ncbi:PDGLE domain-containing protein [Syntrophomonas wolfei]|jgi:hypothetical protein|uniref:PDGLE domain-containing protein n=1 Tax=Syntrophomonas wolfei TaxID=863 RepID=UPI0023F45CFA|nr:PDGLE domain-containing protein [Syntrophomonas wolfei]
MFRNYKALWLALGTLIILSPLGLLATGTAFGEWGLDELVEEVGFIPAGLEKLAEFWQHSLLPDYGIPGMDATFGQAAFGYIFSAMVGVILVSAAILILSKIAKD